jgi:light-regulated signal transduction histidine kinase (bacteriophytochrome)
LPRRTPKVTSAHEFLEITHDFVDPKDAIREAISNAMDWKATKINVKVTEDRNRADEELIIEFSDNGSGLDEERLEAFFDLGKSINNATVEQIGNKGHGTKTYYNSRQIEVESKTATTTVRAAMDQPLQNLMNAIVPPYEYDISRDQNNSTTGTTIRVYGYNMNQRKPDLVIQY